MPDSLFSPTWYRVAAQHPRLRAEVSVQRQQVRDQRWFLLVNGANGRQVRINEKAYEFIGRCDGARTVQQVWDWLVQTLADQAPTQDEVIQTLSELDQHELLAHDTTPDARTLVRRRDEREKKRTQGAVNPFALRVPMGDPSKPLRGLDRLARLVFNPYVLWLWIAGIAFAAASAASQLDAMIAHAREYMLTPRYLIMAWFSFPLVKALHELGHALAVRRWGGEVHEAGFTLFIMVPAPYVDASASAAFPARYQRLAVSGAGIMVELAIAAAALTVWLNVQPGLIRDFAFVTMSIASVSTLMFNGNPLLRFDAYYILCDALDLPNLDTRSKTWWFETVVRALGGRVEGLQLARGEGKWLFVYWPASFIFRLIISAAIVLWLGEHSAVLALFAGLALAILMVVKPAVATTRRLWTALEASSGGRRRGLTIAGAAGAIVLLLAIPLPFHTVATGIVSPPDQARVRAGTDGFITEILARDGDWVTQGQVLLVLDDPALNAEQARLTQRLEQLHAGRYAAFTVNAEQVARAEEELKRVRSELQRVEQKIAELELRAQVDGVLVMPQQLDLPGTFVKQGMTLAHVLERTQIGIRAAVPEVDAALLRDSLKEVEVRLNEDGAPLAARIVRDIPAATHELPSPALGDRGGGEHPTDPADKEGLRTRQPIVLVDVEVASKSLERIGGTAWVRFDHGLQPLAQRWYRQMRQVLLQHVNPAG